MECGVCFLFFAWVVDSRQITFPDHKKDICLPLPVWRPARALGKLDTIQQGKTNKDHVVVRRSFA